MLITNDFIFYFESEDALTLFENIYGENWQEEVLEKQHFCLKDDIFLSIYLNELKPKNIQEYFESFMLGFIFLNTVNPERNNLIATSSTVSSLIVQSCLALVECSKIPPVIFFDEYDQSEFDDLPKEDNNGSEIIPLMVKGVWLEIGLNALEMFTKNGWIYSTEFDSTSIGMSPEEGLNDYLFNPTNIFLVHFDDFEIEQF